MAEQGATGHVGEVIASNLRRLRGDRSPGDVARSMRTSGARGWDAATVEAVESGRRPVRADELPALCRVLTCNVTELFEGGGDVEALGGHSSEAARREQVVRRASRQEAERSAARCLQVDPLAVSRAAFNLWGKSLTARREEVVAERAPDDPSRGLVTLQLAVEIAGQLIKDGSASPPKGGGQRGQGLRRLPVVEHLHPQ